MSKKIEFKNIDEFYNTVEYIAKQVAIKVIQENFDVRFAKVVSYNSTTKIAVIELPNDNAQLSIKNLSGSTLTTDDTVIVKPINGSLSNAYIDKKINI